MNQESIRLQTAIKRFKKRLADADTPPDQRAVFTEALKNAEAEYDSLLRAQSSRPATQPPAIAQEPQSPRYNRQVENRTKSPIEQQEATPDQVAAYLAGRDKKPVANPIPTNGQRASASAASDTDTAFADADVEKKNTTWKAAKPAERVVGMAASGADAERVVVFQVQQANEYVPSFSFIKSDSTEILLKPGDIWSLFRSRMKDLGNLKKPLQYSKMLPWAVAYYEALCIYNRRELELTDFGFSSQRHKDVFKCIQQAANMEIGQAGIEWSTSRTRKPKFYRRASAVPTSRNTLRQMARRKA